MTIDSLQQLGTFRADQVSADTIFRGDGRRVGSRGDDPTYEARFDEALDLYTRALQGRRMDMFTFQEAMSTSDFQFLFADIIQRQTLGSYTEWPSTWSTIARRGTRNDFRVGRAFMLDGAEGALASVPEYDEYPDSAVTDSKYEYGVGKFGRRIKISWESIINDDLGMLRDLPNRLAKAARMTEEKTATALYAAASGPNATFFHTVNNANRMTAKLSTGSLQEAMRLIWSQKDRDGNPIFTGKLRLVVPPNLAITARNILNATEIRYPETGNSTTGSLLIAQNWTPQEVSELVVNPWLPIISATANGDTSWYLFADPSVGRPAMELGFLRGNEVPALFAKEPNARRVGGGTIAAEDGDFDSDSIEYKVRFVVGGVLMEPKSGVASDGSTVAL
jgi:hypothetical protein